MLMADSDSRASTLRVSRSTDRTPLTVETQAAETGDWNDGGQVDTDELTLIHADNPVVKSLINGRDEGQTPDGFDPDHETGDTAGNAYPYGQCTWWAYKRRTELGLPVGSHFGNGGDWATSASRLGYWVDNTPLVGDIVSFKPGQQGVDATYGHVAIVEQVHEDGSITISEANVGGQVGPFSRDITAGDAGELSYIHY